MTTLPGHWVTRNVELAADPAVGWALLHAITTYTGVLEGTGHGGSPTVRTTDGALRARHDETVVVSGALSGSFVDFGPIAMLPGQHNDLDAKLDPAMGTGD